MERMIEETIKTCLIEIINVERQKAKSELFKGITRIEIIEGSERKFVKWNCKIEPSFQDNNRTLKIFVEAI